MKRKTVSGIMLTLLLTSMLTLSFNIQPVKAAGTIYIRADGSIDPPTAPIQKDGDIDTFTDNINGSIVVERDNIVVNGAGCTVQGTGGEIGIKLTCRKSVIVKNAIIKGFVAGIYLQNSTHNILLGNQAIANNWCGIRLEQSSYNTLDSNYCAEGDEFGIILSSSQHNVLRSNIMTDSNWNFGVFPSYYPFACASEYDNDIDVSNIVNGKPVYYWIGRIGMTVPNEAGYVALICCREMTVENLDLANNAQSILLAFTDHSTVTNNTVTNNMHGVELVSSICNHIRGNNLANNRDGLHFQNSGNNSIYRNNITKNKGYSGWKTDRGIYLESSSSNNIHSNHITGLEAGILLYRSLNNIVHTNKITNNGEGVGLSYGSSNNEIYANSITSSNNTGVHIWVDSDSNIIRENEISKNIIGLYLELYGYPPAQNNKFYHNDFTDNMLYAIYFADIGFAVWDDGYPSGGNYWSDYSGIDEKRGPSQDQPGSDGIGDTPYIIDADNRDRYPLMAPWTPAPPEAPDNFADLGNLTDEATHNLIGWGGAQGPPENPHVSPSGDTTKRYMLLRGNNSVDLMVDEAGVPYYLTAEVEDGYGTDNFEIYINGEGPIYAYIGKNVGTGPVTAVRHEVLVPAEYITEQKVTITFRNTATDNFGLAAVYNVQLTLTPLPKFSIGDWVKTTANLNVRDGPGLYYAIIGTVPEETVGQIAGGPVEADGYVWWDVDYFVEVRGWSAQNWLERSISPPNQPPTCIISLQKDGFEISEVKIGEFLDIFAGYSTDDKDIKEMRFSSDDVQDGMPTGRWTDWFDWAVSLEDWNAMVKTKRWSFATPGRKEVWAEAKDEEGQINLCSDVIFVPAPALPMIFSPLVITPAKEIYNVGDTLEAEFTIKNIGDVPITLDVLTVGGRLNGFIPPEGAPDFTFQSVTLQPNEPYQYQGSLTLDRRGSYHFFVAYYVENPTSDEKKLLDESNWNTCVDLGEGLTHTDRVKNIIVYKEGTVPEEIDQLNEAINRCINMERQIPAYLIDPDQGSWAASVWVTVSSVWTHVQEEYDELWQASVDHSCMSRIEAIHAKSFLDSGDIDSAKKHLQKSFLQDKISTLYSNAAIDVFDRNVKAAMETVKSTLKLIEVGVSLINPAAGKYASWVFMIPNIIADKELVGVDQTVKNVFVDIAFKAVFGEFHYPQLGGRTLEDYLNNKVGKLTFPVVQEFFKNNDALHFHLEHALKEIASEEAEWLTKKILDELSNQWPLDTYKEHSPIELRVYDSRGKITGLMNGSVRHEISTSFYRNGTVMIFFPYEPYICEVAGKEEGTYGLEISSVEAWNATIFTASDIPTSTNAIHQYTVDWAALSQGEDGVSVQIDSNGDGEFECTFTSDSELTQGEYVIATDKIPPETWLNIGEPRFVVNDVTYLTSATPVSLIAQDNPDGSGVASTAYRIHNASYDNGWKAYTEPFYITGLSEGSYQIEYNSTDYAGNIEPTQTLAIFLDNSGPLIVVENPPVGWALEDGITFIALSTDSSGTCSLNFSIREANGDQGMPVGFEDMPATYNTTTGKWEFFFDTLQLPDGFYIVLVSAEDNLGHTASITVPYSIRNWAVLELLPATPNNKAGRTMPVKFALRVAASVDPKQPFVYNEELTIKIYATDNPSNILQTSTFGDTARDYRINTLSEQYITNFQTLKTPKTYMVEIWRKDMLIGTFGFQTDLKVNIFDVAVVAKAFGTSPGDENWNEMADLDENDLVNILDIATTARAYGNEVTEPESYSVSTLSEKLSSL